MKKLLDLYCKAGGASKGYADAGFQVTGVDIQPQPNYPFEFHQADVLTLGIEFIKGFDAVHASPPCQAYSRLNALHKKNYPDLLSATRERLIEAGMPYVIENVEGAPLINPIMLCGTMFGLKVFRHRLFESNIAMLAPSHPFHNGSPGTHRYPRKEINGYKTIAGHNFTLEEGSKAMGINWMKVRKELAEAIPPAYTEHIGRWLMNAIEMEAHGT